MTVGDDLLRVNFPLVHAVGRASAGAPRMIELTWGDAGDPRVSLVGKGVCFDSGGLDIKTDSAMLLMKKDMGGAATVLALAQMIMDRKLKVRLEVLIPAVENAISGAAYRPRDVYRSRKGLTVEIGNTDAEGRLVLADALARADESAPELLIDMGTLTGAARVALGPDLPPFYTQDQALAARWRATPRRKTIRSGGCRYGSPMTQCSIPRSPTSTTWRRAASPARSCARCSCSVSSSERKPGCISTSSPGRRRQSRAGPRAASARPPARSMRCSSSVTAERADAMPAFDPRVTPARADLAAKALEGKVRAARYVEGRVYEVVEPQAPLRLEPRHDAPLATEALAGERVTIYDANAEGWAWGQLAADGYVGWLPGNALAEPGAPPTHKVTVPRTLVFPGPSIRLPPSQALPFGARLAVARTHGRFAVTRSGAYVPDIHLAPIDAYEADFVAVAERFVGAPYLWGGKTALGARLLGPGPDRADRVRHCLPARQRHAGSGAR